MHFNWGGAVSGHQTLKHLELLPRREGQSPGRGKQEELPAQGWESYGSVGLFQRRTQLEEDSESCLQLLINTVDWEGFFLCRGRAVISKNIFYILHIYYFYVIYLIFKVGTQVFNYFIFHIA